MTEPKNWDYAFGSFTPPLPWAVRGGTNSCIINNMDNGDVVLFRRDSSNESWYWQHTDSQGQLISAGKAVTQIAAFEEMAGLGKARAEAEAIRLLHRDGPVDEALFSHKKPCKHCGGSGIEPEGEVTEQQRLYNFCYRLMESPNGIVWDTEFSVGSVTDFLRERDHELVHLLTTNQYKAVPKELGS